MIPVSRPSIGREELEEVGRVFETGWLGLGSVVKEFEEEVKKFIGAEYVIAVNTGTSALHLALEAIGVKEGDEVLLPSLTFVATAQAVTMQGAKPVFCDVREEDLNIDPEDIRTKITEKTKAIIPVHYRGQPCEMDEILEIAQEKNIRVIEDAAHAFGTSYKGKKIGSFGDITCFSFDPIKNITCGEGGAILVREEELYRRLVNKRMLAMDNDAWSRYAEKRSLTYDVVEQGYRYHMSNINAAIGKVQIKKFKKFNERKIEVAKRYDEAFGDIPEIKLLKTDYGSIGLFAYIIRVKRARNELIDFLNKKEIGAGIHYTPVHFFSYYRKFATPLPITERASEEIITLPCFPDITNEEVDNVIKAVKEFFKNR